MAADKSGMTFDTVERQWIKLALNTQAAVLKRKVNGETNPEIIQLREKEIGAIQNLIGRFQSET